MSLQVSTQYDNYQELLLDLDVFGRISANRQLDIDGYKELFFEEFKKQKPMPTMESKRYELSRLVDNDYRVEYNKQIELRENELLVDFNDTVSKESYANVSYNVNERVQDLFTYEKQVKDSDRAEILRKYSLDTGELLDGIRPSELLGTIQEDDSLRLDEIEIENLGTDTPIFHDETVDTFNEEEFESVDTEVDEDEFESADLEENFDELESSDFEDLESNEVADNEEEFDNEIDEDLQNDNDLEEFFEEKNSEFTDSDNDFDSFFDEDKSETNLEVENNVEEQNLVSVDKETSNSDLSLETLVQLLGNKLDANIDLEQLKHLIKPKEESDLEHVELEEQTDNVLDNFFDSNEEIDNDFFFESNNDVEIDKDKNLQDNFDVGDLGFELSESENKEVEIQQEPIQESIKEENVIDRESEPKDLREFIRKHPRCEYDFATKYFTPKQIAMEIKKGRVIKRGNLLKI